MTARYGILAYPAGHSLSPRMQQAAFDACGIDAVYERFEVAPKDLERFMLRMREEGIAGLSVSLPHKVSIMRYMDEVSDAARVVGAVNTVAVREGKLYGDNTDWVGAMEALATVCDIHTERAAVLGSGGAARAVVYGLQQRRAKEVVVVARNKEERDALAREFGIAAYGMEALGEVVPEVIVNTTPLGMRGSNEDMTPVPAEYFVVQQPVVFDIVYTPLYTRLLREAREAGCAVVTGVPMFVFQGAAQFRLWTGKEAPIAVMEREVMTGLAK